MSRGQFGWALASLHTWSCVLEQILVSEQGGGRHTLPSGTPLATRFCSEAMHPLLEVPPWGPDSLPSWIHRVMLPSWPTASLSMVSGDSTDLQTQRIANRIHHSSHSSFSRSPAWAPSQLLVLTSVPCRQSPVGFPAAPIPDFLSNTPYAFRKATPTGLPPSLVCRGVPPIALLKGSG